MLIIEFSTPYLVSSLFRLLASFCIDALGTDHLTWRGWGGGGYGFFLNKYSDSQCCWKKYSDFGGGKKKSDSEFLSCKLTLNSGKKNILTLVLSEKQILNEKKTHTPPFLLNGRSLIQYGLYPLLLLYHVIQLTWFLWHSNYSE